MDLHTLVRRTTFCIGSAILLLMTPAEPCRVRGDETTESDVVEDLKDLLALYDRGWSKFSRDDSEAGPTGEEVLEAMRALDDKQLQDAMREIQGEELELFLSEAIRRGGKKWQEFLVLRWETIQREHKESAERENGLPFVFPLQNVIWLTAIRRVEGKPDPLRILPAGKRTRSCNLGYLPVFSVMLTNLDRDKAEIVFTEGGNYRSGRQARWRFEVIDADGQAVPPRPRSLGMGGGMYQHGKLEYGESWATELNMNRFVEITSPGEYTVRILYHDDITIADCADVTGLVTCTSLPIKLTVDPIVVSMTKAERTAVREAIAELPTKGPVKLLGGAYVESVHSFIKPDSAAGRLLEMGWKAVPGLIDAALDEKLDPTRRAWVLGLLAGVTNHNNPRHEPGVLGPHEFRDSGWSVFGGAPGTMSGGLGWSEDKSLFGDIDPKRQLAFAKRWTVWKEKQYVKVVEEE